MPYPQDYKCTCEKGRLCRFCARQEKAFYDDEEVLEPTPEDVELSTKHKP